MKRKTLAILTAALCLFAALAAADTLSMDGKVEAKETVEVYAPIGGTVARVVGEVGQEVEPEDVLLELRTTKVYADEDGIVTGIFGEPGDAAETVAGRYGAVLYIEGSSAFKAEATTENAYNSASSKFVHVGETLYVRCKSNTSRNGTGRITAVDGTAFTVEIEEGNFIPGDAVELYRDKGHSNSKHVGSGTISRQNPTAVTAGGSIVRIAVEDGQSVKKGDLLLETLTGEFDAYEMTGAEIAAGSRGVIAELKAEQGAQVAKDSVVAVLYDRAAMRIAAEVPEDSLGEIAAGDNVHIELAADESKTYEGTVKLISGVASTGTSGEVTYRALIDFTPDDAVRYGMSVIVETMEAETAAAEEPAEEEEPDEAEEAEPEEDKDEAERPARGERPEGFPEGGMPEGGEHGGRRQQDGSN
ncbi:MAG: HlyD family efflux transporter periplasmic adaptor subunit [Clostridia bacterium]|nr:HlyD family efflux transporter periplasmic adaptor subunit [Clostridia bacterium]